MGVEDRIRLKAEISGYGLDVVGFISSDDSFNEITKTIQEFPMIYQRLYSEMCIRDRYANYIISKTKARRRYQPFSAYPGPRSAV